MFIYEDINLDIALRKIDELSMQDGDLGYEYWQKIAKILKEAESNRKELFKLRSKSNK